MRYMNLYLRASIPQLETFLAVKRVIDEWDPLHLFPCAPLEACPPWRDTPTLDELAGFVGYVCCDCNHYYRGWAVYRAVADKVIHAIKNVPA